jgi:predicted amidohydrolase
MRFLAAVVQLTTTTDVEASLTRAEALIDEAAARGARLVALPENVSFMGTEAEKLALAEPLDGPSFSRLSAKARQHGLFLLAGTLPERRPEAPERSYNTSVLFGPDGGRLAVYRKIHLFDVQLGPGATHLESASVEPGSHAVLAETPLGRLGMTVCYDVRFPGLFRALVRAGAQLLAVPAAFTVPTGRDHWEVLLRARAIESQCFVLAPAQFGQNGPNRATYGRSMIIDPWGTVLATCPDRPSVAVAELDLSMQEDLRARLPCLSHERTAAYHVRTGGG